MRHICQTILIVPFTLAALVAQEEQRSIPGIIPTPRIALTRDTRFTITPRTIILLESDSGREQFAARQINDELAGWRAQRLAVVPVQALQKQVSNFIFIGSPVSVPGGRFLKERNGVMKPEMAAEGYFLDVSSRGIVIIGDSERGRFYGVMSLLQMMHRENHSVVVNGATIYDFPLHRIRGITDDISRGQVSTVANFKKIIRFLARYKMNTYSPYLEDMFSFKNHPLIGKGRGALTAEEVQEIDAYARRFYIDMVPTFQTLGHWENILALPEYVGYAEYPGGRTLNVSDEGVYSLLEKMIGEVCSSFSSPYFNMAADETRDVGLGANKERVAQIGLAAVLAEHYKRVAHIIRRHGKKPMIYGDIILKNPEILEMIPKDMTIIDWNYDPLYQFDSPKVFRGAGFPFIVSPAVRNYVGPFIDVFNSFENIQRFSRAGYEDGADGVLVSSWNDYGGEELRELNYYGYAWGAECAWNPTNAEIERFNSTFFRDFFGTTDDRVYRTAYAILSSASNHYSWYELWRHPMLPFSPPTPQKGHSPNIMERLQSIKSTMPFVLSLLEEGKKNATRNIENLEYLQFVAQLNLWFAEKVECQEKVQRLCKSSASPANNDSLANEVVTLCRRVLDHLAPLRNRFARLWLTTNKPEGLELLLMRYDRQVAYWQEKIEQVKRGELWIDPEIESAWIYHPGSASTGKDSAHVPHTYFRGVFAVPKGVQSATLQLIGDTYVKVWVNERFVGEVYVRRSNSLSTEHQRIKAFDILPFLTDSTNVIAAEAQDYSVAGSAGTNIYCEMRPHDGTAVRILSNERWRVADAPAPGWLSASFDDSQWMSAVTKKYPFTVLRPDFSTGRTSWIER